MASDNEASCVSDPNFAVICSFLEHFGKNCGLDPPDISRLQEMLENVQEVSQELVDLHIKLLRKARKSVAPEKWEKALIKFCHTYSNQDGWELERIGYKKARIAIKLRLLKTLLESQFDLNQKFKNEINKLTATELRLEPLGRDKSGMVYWCHMDEECNIRVYREDLDEENWELIAKTREEVVLLINNLSDGKIGAIPISEDSNSLETSEKPIIDTGQDDNTPNGDKKLDNDCIEKDVDKKLNSHQTIEEQEEEEEDEDDEEDEDEEDEDEEDEDKEEEEEEEEEDEKGESEEKKDKNAEEESKSKSKTDENNSKLNNHVKKHIKQTADKQAKLNVEIVNQVDTQKTNTFQPTVIETLLEESEPKELNVKNGTTDNITEGPKSIETPVITTSPLKLVNISELKHSSEKKLDIGKISVINNLPHGTTTEVSSGHNKLPIKPIDQLAANLSKIQTEKLEGQKSTSKLEKIAENLAKGQVNIHSVASNGEEIKKNNRGIDLSTSPRGWETGNNDMISSNAGPVDFSGIDLTRKISKEVTSPAGYRGVNFSLQQQQHKEMDLSTRKNTNKSHQNLATYDQMYDSHSIAMRNVNHVMVADLSKRQMPYSPLNLQPNTFQPSRHSKDDVNTLPQRLPGYPLLPVRMPGAPLKRSLDEPTNEAMLKRMRSDLQPLRAGMSPGSFIQQQQQKQDWKNEVGEAIEEPVMMVQGEGSGSDCDAVNPIVEEEIEEPLIYFYGEGSGADCCTGNPTDKTPDTNENKAVESNKNEAENNEPCSSDTKNSKPKFKLGVQVFSSTISSAKRTSRWDVGAPDEKINISTHNQGEKSNDDSPPKFFFGPNCVSYGAEKTKASTVPVQLNFETTEDNGSLMVEPNKEKDTTEMVIPESSEEKSEQSNDKVEDFQKKVYKIDILKEVDEEAKCSELKKDRIEDTEKYDSNKALSNVQIPNEYEKKEILGKKDSLNRNEAGFRKENIFIKTDECSQKLITNENLQSKNPASNDKNDHTGEDELKKISEQNKNKNEHTIGDFEDELGKTLAAMNEFDEKLETTINVDKKQEKEKSIDELEKELSRIDESDFDNIIDAKTDISKEIPTKSDINEGTLKTKEKTGSVTNLLSSLEDEDSVIKSKIKAEKDVDFSTNLKNESDFLGISNENKIMPQQKVNEEFLKDSKSDNVNVLVIPESERTTKMIENLVFQKKDAIYPPEQKPIENIVSNTSTKLEDSSFLYDFGKENQSLSNTELDDTVKMEETFSVENTSRLVRLSPERIDESLSSHENSSFRENINTESRELPDTQDTSTSRPMSVSDEQTCEGDFSFLKADDTRDMDSMSNESEQTKDEILPPSADLTIENLKQKNAETEGSITIPGILGIKKLDENASEASSLIVECASSVREDEEDSFSVDPTDNIITDEKSNDIFKEEDSQMMSISINNQLIDEEFITENLPEKQIVETPQNICVESSLLEKNESLTKEIELAEGTQDKISKKDYSEKKLSDFEQHTSADDNKKINETDCKDVKIDSSDEKEKSSAHDKLNFKKSEESSFPEKCQKVDSITEKKTELGFQSLVPNYDSSSEEDKNFDDSKIENISKPEVSPKVNVSNDTEVPIEQDCNSGKKLTLSEESEKEVDHMKDKVVIKVETENVPSSGKNDERVEEDIKTEKEIFDRKQFDVSKEIVLPEIIKTDPTENDILAKMDILDTATVENIQDIADKTTLTETIFNNENNKTKSIGSIVNSSELFDVKSQNLTEETSFDEVNEEALLNATGIKNKVDDFVGEVENSCTEKTEIDAKLEDQSSIIHPAKKRKEETNDFLSEAFKKSQTEDIPKNKLELTYHLEMPNNSIVIDTSRESSHELNEKILYSPSNVEITEIKDEDASNKKIEDNLSKCKSTFSEKYCMDEGNDKKFNKLEDQQENISSTKNKFVESIAVDEKASKNLTEMSMKIDPKSVENVTSIRTEDEIIIPLSEKESNSSIEKSTINIELLDKKNDSFSPKNTEGIQEKKPIISDTVKNEIVEPIEVKVVHETREPEEESSLSTRIEIRKEIVDTKMVLEKEVEDEAQSKDKLEKPEIKIEKFTENKNLESKNDSLEEQFIKQSENMQLSEVESPVKMKEVHRIEPEKHNLKNMQSNNDEELSDDSMGNDESMFDAPPAEDCNTFIESEPEINESSKPVEQLTGADSTLATAQPTCESSPPVDPSLRTTRTSRKRRNSAHDSNSEDTTSMTRAQSDDEETTAGKRMKLRAKRQPDLQLRKSIEKTRKISASSEDDSSKVFTEANVIDCSHEETAQDDGQESAFAKKSRGRPRGKKRKGGFSKGRPQKKAGNDSAGEPVDETIELRETTTDEPSLQNEKLEEKLNEIKEPKKKQRKKRTVMGLEIPADIDSTTNESETPVRASRRIAQLKIKKEADKSREEEVQESGKKYKKDKSGKHDKHGQDSLEKKKRKKKKNESEEDAAMMKDLEKEAKKKRRRRKKKLNAKFDESKPWQSSSGSSDTDENEHEEDEDEEMESDGEQLVFKSDHEFSPESDLEGDNQTSEPVRHARTAQKSKSDDEAEIDEYACQKCSKADHPEWILLCDSCDKGWHCSCLRPALMLIPEGDWFCPPCQHKSLVLKLQESLKNLDVMTKKHENEILRKKRLAYVGISLENVLQKGEGVRTQRDSRASSQDDDEDDDDGSSEEGSTETSSSEGSSSDESEPVYQLRERRCANTSYKFNEYDDMINAAIKDEVEAGRVAGNQGRGKDITTIVNAEKEEKAQTEAFKEELNETEIQKSEKESDEGYKVEKDEDEEAEDEEDSKAASKRKLLARKKHRKLNCLDVSSEEDDPYSDEDFKGSSSDEEEDPDEQLSSSEYSDMGGKRRGRRGESRAVRRSTRARQTRYDKDFINDDSDDSDRPKKKKSRAAAWGSESEESEESDNSWRETKKRRTSVPRRSIQKVKPAKKKKKRKRIITQDSDDDDEEQSNLQFNLAGEIISSNKETDQSNEPVSVAQHARQFETSKIHENQELDEQKIPINEPLPMQEDIKSQENEIISPTYCATPTVIPTFVPTPVSTTTTVSASAAGPISQYVPTPLLEDESKRKKKEPKQKKIRRKFIYGRIPDENEATHEEDTTLGRRTRGRKISYLDAMPSDSDEELKKALRKTEETEEEFVVHTHVNIEDDAEKDSDSGDVYSPKQLLGPKGKSPRGRGKKSPGGKRKSISEDGTPKVRKKPGPKPGSRKGTRMNKSNEDLSVMDAGIINDTDMMGMQVDDSGQGVLSENVTGEGSLASLNPAELEGLDDDQIDQLMIEDEEYGRRQLELAAIEINKKKKKEEREAKKLEKARQKALEILEAERLESMNMEGVDGDIPKKKKRGRRSKAEILADQMRRESLGLPPEQPLVQQTPPPSISHQFPPQGPHISAGPPHISSPGEMIVSPSVVPNIPVMDTCDQQRMMDNPMMPMMTPGMMENQPPMFSPDNSPLKPKRRGRGKGKKTLAMEAARAAEAAAKVAGPGGRLGMPSGDISGDDMGVLPTPGSSTSGSAPSTPPANQPQSNIYQGPPPQPPQQSSVITRMLQSQPPSVPNSSQTFTQAAAAMGHKYFGGPNVPGQMMPGQRPSYDLQNRGRIPSPYRQVGPQTLPAHFDAVRSGGLPGAGIRLRVPGPQMYHTPHHPLDPSPSGGGPISINTRDRSSPLGHGPQMIPPSAGSPLSKGGPTPPPPYVRGVGRFGDVGSMNPRHPLPPFSNASPGVVNHALQQSPASNRPGGGNFSPYHPPPPPNYHYGAYPPPPPMSTADDAAAYQSSPYSTSAEHFSSPAADRSSNIQGPSQQQPQVTTQQQSQLQPPVQPSQGPAGGPGAGPHPHGHPSHSGHPGHPGHPHGKYDEEGSGEFGGLVSYFSSQREDDIES